MATSYLAIKKELECLLCHCVLKEPKIVGSCHHVFCKGCLQENIDTKQSSGVFRCPGCHVEYTVPTNGTDGFKDDFRTANLVAILRKADASAAAYERHPCTECQGRGATNGSNLAEFLCDTCDLDLCLACRRSHSALSAEHIIYDLCSTHWRKMKQFCRTCSTVICGVCMASAHSGPGHTIIPYRDSFCEEVTKVLDKAGQTLTLAEETQKAAEKNGESFLAEAASRMSTACTNAKTLTDSSNSEIAGLRNKIKEMEEKVVKLEKRVECVTSRRDIFVKTENEVVLTYAKGMQTFKEVLSDLMRELRTQSEELGQLKGTGCLGLDHSRRVYECKEEIRRLTANIKDTLKAAPKQHTDVLPPLPNMDPDTADFTSAIYLKELSFKENGVDRIFSIEVLPNERGIAALVGPSSNRGSSANTILYSLTTEPKQVHKISDGLIQPASDMAMKRNGDLVVLRSQSPHIRLFQYSVDSKCYTHSKSNDLKLANAPQNPKSIAIDEERNICIILHTQGGPTAEVLLVNGYDGCVTQTVGCRDSGRLACHPLNQLIYKCYRGVQLFKYNGTDELRASKEWQFPTTEIFDINLSAEGQLYAAGKSNRKVTLDVIGKPEVKKIRSLGTLLDEKGQPLVSDMPCNPRSALRGDLLLIGVGSRVLFYRLM